VLLVGPVPHHSVFYRPDALPWAAGSPGKRAVKRVCVCVCAVGWASERASAQEVEEKHYMNL